MTREHIVKYLVWRRIKMIKQNKIINFWILKMQFCVDAVPIIIFVLMVVHFNPQWNSQTLITINDASGFLLILFYFHKFNGGFKFGRFFYLTFFSSVLTIQGDVYVLELCQCRWSYGQTLCGYMECLVHFLMFDVFKCK